MATSGRRHESIAASCNHEIMSRLPGAPPYHAVMDASAHKGIDYVNGYFGPEARIDRRELQPRDHEPLTRCAAVPRGDGCQRAQGHRLCEWLLRAGGTNRSPRAATTRS